MNNLTLTMLILSNIVTASVMCAFGYFLFARFRTGSIEQLNVERVNAITEITSLKTNLEQYKTERSNLEKNLLEVNRLNKELEVKLVEANKSLAVAHERNLQVLKLQDQLTSSQNKAVSLRDENEELSNTNSMLTKGTEMLREQLVMVQQEKLQRDGVIERQQKQLSSLREQMSDLMARTEVEKQSSNDKLRLLQQSEGRLTEQFENLANRIFDKKATTIQHTNKENLESTLAPFKQTLGEFKKQVSDSYQHEALERRSLKQEIMSLKEIHQQLAEDAMNLASAIKGDNKTQGTWGEMILDTVLQNSGLREGHEYQKQLGLKDEDGHCRKPDVVVHLPDDKDIVIDSKVSLKSWEQYCNALEESDRGLHMKELIASMKTHIMGLSKKNYQDLYGINALDYVLLFVPVEPAFYMAVNEAPELFQFALDKKIMLVSPTNLLVSLRTIENVWRFEYQNRNAQAISDKAGGIYDKLCGFVGDMERLGKQLGASQVTYENAMSKFSQGRGNLIRQAQGFVDMGVKVKKLLPKEVTDVALLDIEPKLKEVEYE